jgi:energy-coupling factor transporter ATP-binding protein EcfA2
MKIKTIRIQNFRGFSDATVDFEDHTCLVGPNGAGKSTVLSALNVFFQEASNATEVASLTREDFHSGNVDAPVEITVTFYKLTETAQKTLEHYVRHGELAVVSRATFDPVSQRAPVQQFGKRLVFAQFKPYFEDEKNKVLIEPLRARFNEVTSSLADFAVIGGKPSKIAMTAALRSYEEARPEICTPEESTDLFYGTQKVRGKLDPFVQWIYLPAVKDASEEVEEAGNTALGKLLQRTVRQKVNFDEALEALRAKTRKDYDALLEKEQNTLAVISESLAARLAVFAHPGASIAVEWLQGSEKSVSIGDPRATIKAQEGSFKGSMTRFGHGLQRSFLLAILQELASVELESETERPTLILGCEEPELYQHPPQARHLSSVLRSLADAGNQIMLTTHSAYFVSGEIFNEIRLIRKDSKTGRSYVKSTDFDCFCERIGKATGKKPDKAPVARAKLMAALRPEPAELFFCQRLVLVEGTADRAYVSGALHLSNEWDAMRRAGLHIIPTDNKSGILQLLVIAQELSIPCFVIFDADGNAKEQHRPHHEIDNKALFSALSITSDAFPTTALWGEKYAIWPHNIEAEVRACFDGQDFTRIENAARASIDARASLKKQPALIGEFLTRAWAENKPPKVLVQLVESFKKFSSAIGEP